MRKFPQCEHETCGRIATVHMTVMNLFDEREQYYDDELIRCHKHAAAYVKHWSAWYSVGFDKSRSWTMSLREIKHEGE